MPKITYYYRIIRTVYKGFAWETKPFNFNTKKEAGEWVIEDKKENPTAEYQLQTMVK